jgi:hypothetical protein
LIFVFRFLFFDFCFRFLFWWFGFATPLQALCGRPALRSADAIPFFDERSSDEAVSRLAADRFAEKKSPYS